LLDVIPYFGSAVKNFVVQPGGGRVLAVLAEVVSHAEICD